MLNIQSTSTLHLIQAGGSPIDVTYSAKAHREVSLGGHIDEYVGIAHVSLPGIAIGSFQCGFRFKTSMATAFVAERVVDEAIRGHLAVNPRFLDWLRRAANA